jgi:hypothetical protein
MYTRDLVALDVKVAELKRRGFTKATKSELIRIALANLTLESAAAHKEMLQLESAASVG